jgi:hypothetical protein
LLTWRAAARCRSPAVLKMLEYYIGAQAPLRRCGTPLRAVRFACILCCRAPAAVP